MSTPAGSSSWWQTSILIASSASISTRGQVNCQPPDTRRDATNQCASCSRVALADLLFRRAIGFGPPHSRDEGVPEWQGRFAGGDGSLSALPFSAAIQRKGARVSAEAAPRIVHPK